MNMDIFEGINAENLLELAYLYGIKILTAIITLVIGLWLVKYLRKVIVKALERADVDKALFIFLNSLCSFIFKALVYITAFSMLGVEMTAFIAILGAAGLAVGLALQGSLANFAGGVLILLFKPFRVGDYIEGGSQDGTVERIDILHTVLKAVNGQKVVIPIGDLANSAIINYSAKETRRAVMYVRTSYQAD